MIAVVYSGSKSAYWKIYQSNGNIIETSTPSINPALYDSKQILQLLNKNIQLINCAESLKRLYAFAAGADSEFKQIELDFTLKQFFINCKIKVKDDVHGAAIAACDNRPGIIGILGSGANCAYYNGKFPKKNNYGLGYILADEGSSNYLGKILLKNYLEDKLPTELKNSLQQKYLLDRGNILERIYRRPHVQSYLSSFLEFIIENRNHHFIQQMIDDGFKLYLENYILPMTKKHPQNEIHFVGNIAGIFQDRLRLIAKQNNIEIISIIREPLHNILNYYIN